MGNPPRLVFIGLGLDGPENLSERARAELRAAEALFAESYTSIVPVEEWNRLEAALGRRLTLLSREQVESGTEILHALQQGGSVVLLTGGDPFAATTHLALRLQARGQGVPWSYVPGASVVTAVPGFLGLQQYRFGRIVSIPYPAPGFAPHSYLERIGENRRADLHTLVLLDLDPPRGRSMGAGEALALLSQQEAEHPLDPPLSTISLAVAARVGRPDARGFYGPLRDLLAGEFGATPHALVVPAPNLHFQEAEALEEFRVLPRRTERKDDG